MTSLLFEHRESAAPIVPTLAPHATSKSRDIHVQEGIPRVSPHPKCQDRDEHRVCKRGDFAAVGSSAASIRIVVVLKSATACAAYTAAFTILN